MNETKSEKNVDIGTASNENIDDEPVLSEKAKILCNSSEQILNALESYRRGILCHKYLTSIGRHLALSDLKRMKSNSIQVLNYAAENPMILQQNLPSVGPLIIGGLPRTGTTLLYNLLACDPNCRAPFMTDMNINVVPPIARSDFLNQKQRYEAAITLSEIPKYFSQFMGEIATAHPFYQIEEDYVLLRHASYLPFFPHISIHDDDDTDAWLQHELEKDFVYDYHEIFLRMLNSVDTPSSHWLLKSPLHSLQLESILKHYPNALFIMTHRRIDECLPSLCNLGLIMSQWAYEKTDDISRQKMIKRSCQFVKQLTDCISKFHVAQNDNVGSRRRCLFNLKYSDLMSDPLNSVRQIYEYFGLSWSTEFEAAMNKWISENPQGKQGRHLYSLEQFDLKREEIEFEYADYNKLFLA